MKTSTKDLFGSSDRAPELIAFRGLPGSGKTTAIAFLKDRRPNVRVISMDDKCRAELGRLPQSESDEEVGRTRLRTLARCLLSAREHVVVDDINLKEESLDQLAGIARSVTARFVVIDMWQEYQRQRSPVTPNPDLYDTWVELCTHSRRRTRKAR